MIFLQISLPFFREGVREGWLGGDFLYIKGSYSSVLVRTALV